MEREFKEVVCPISKAKVKLKTWLNGHEKLALTEAKEDQVKVQIQMLETVVAEIDGVKEDVANKILDLHGADVDFVIKSITETMTNSTYAGTGKKK